MRLSTMNIENRLFILDFQKILDILIVSFAFIMSYFIRRLILPGPQEILSQDPNYYIVLLTIIFSWHISFKWMGMYISYRKSSFLNFFTIIIKSCCMGIVLLNIILYLMHTPDISRLLMGIFLVLTIVFLSIEKFIIYTVLIKIRASGQNLKNVLIVGSKQRTIDVIKAIENYSVSEYKIIGCLDVKDEIIGDTVFNDYKIIGVLGDLGTLLLNNVVDELVFAMRLTPEMEIEKYIAIAEKVGVNVRIIPEWHIQDLMYKPGIASIRFSDFCGVYTMAIQSTPQNEGELLLKTVMDYAGSFIFLILFLPLFIIVSAGIKIISRGPVFYTQERLGFNGRKFMIYKFRTMINKADELQRELEEMNEADGPVFKIQNDPRIIPWIGTFLRKTSLDELPQLVNVLRGEMSLVGPRPPISSEVTKYSIWQRRRLSMKPGLTCTWQIAPNRNDLSFDDWMKMDLEYIDTWSLYNDFKTLVLTARAVLMGFGR